MLRLSGTGLAEVSIEPCLKWQGLTYSLNQLPTGRVRKHRIDDLMAGSYSPCDINVSLLLKNKQELIH